MKINITRKERRPIHTGQIIRLGEDEVGIVVTRSRCLVLVLTICEDDKVITGSKSFDPEAFLEYDIVGFCDNIKDITFNIEVEKPETDCRVIQETKRDL